MEASFAKSILAEAPMAVVAIDGTGVVRSSNAKADAFFCRELCVGTPVGIARLIPDIDIRGLISGRDLEDFNARSRNGGDGAHMRVRRDTAAEAFVDVQAARFSDGNDIFVTLFIQDVTAVVAAETALQDLHRQITHNWRLNSLGEMASMVAHELNQPLSAILNFLDAAQSLVSRPEIDRSKVQKFIGSAAGQAERASEVIRRLRSLMSRDTGFHADQNVLDLVNEVIPILNINARELDAAITLDIEPDGNAHCDRVQVQQMIVNLVRNALDAPPTHIRRRVLITGRQTGDTYSLLVEDSGPGVSEAAATHLFDPLCSTKPGGMGLGLSICRTIAEAHGGAIEHVPSSLGGAGFALTLNNRSTNV